MRLLTTRAAARELGITERRVVALINAGRLGAEKAGRDWLIEPAALDDIRQRKPGRPTQAAVSQSSGTNRAR